MDDGEFQAGKAKQILDRLHLLYLGRHDRDGIAESLLAVYLFRAETRLFALYGLEEDSKRFSMSA